MRVCHDPQPGVAARKAFIAKRADAGTLVLGTHFPFPTACRFADKGGSYHPEFQE